MRISKQMFLRRAARRRGVQAPVVPVPPANHVALADPTVGPVVQVDHAFAGGGSASEVADVDPVVTADPMVPAEVDPMDPVEVFDDPVVPRIGSATEGCNSGMIGLKVPFGTYGNTFRFYPCSDCVITGGINYLLRGDEDYRYVPDDDCVLFPHGGLVSLVQGRVFVTFPPFKVYNHCIVSIPVGGYVQFFTEPGDQFEYDSDDGFSSDEEEALGAWVEENMGFTDEEEAMEAWVDEDMGL
ncbi:Uncharacterized protein Rs2_42457 [Raphanus sativus]|uniref:Uncharacterized protein LOC108825693 n=1 Tax=Raphanus sativus TaxID=3726 RepID=A0A6J0L2Z6_RAPSA|nr:uncharacterized protein LOC108825693 [Raphanus sativus]XP_056858028.1 uncharacterized protein LOC130507336 [Raphanus sativus]KAJ4866054.1 Uncharacterized protein Rs2_52430 [Raphanus sativus]KAJ4877439.1 Uncharacterized protein Rs2_42457 [Raphanus sativus]